MASLSTYVNSSIVKKQVMAVTGLLLCGFTVSHLIGNFLIIVGPEAFNTYAHTLTSNPLIYVAEGILGLIFLVHLAMAIRLTIENKIARPERYYMKQNTGHGATFASSTMPLTGLVILIFIVFHILHLKFGPHYDVLYGEIEMRDLYRVLIEYFANPLAVAWYTFAMICLSVHVSHGFWSAFQSFGINHPKYNSCINLTAKLYAVVMVIGFSSLPIYCYLQGGH